MLDYGDYGSNNEFLIPQSNLHSAYSVWHKVFGLNHRWFKKSYCLDLDVIEYENQMLERRWGEVQFTGHNKLRCYDIKKALESVNHTAQKMPCYFRLDVLTSTEIEAYRDLEDRGIPVYIVYTTLTDALEGQSKWWVFRLSEAIESIRENEIEITYKPLSEVEYARLLMGHRGIYGKWFV